MTQTLVLMKSAGSAEHLHRLQEEGVLRASAEVMAGCYSAFALAEGPITKPMAASLTSETCNPPFSYDCTLAELMAWLNKVSNSRPLEFIAFALVTVAYGQVGTYEEQVTGLVAGDLPGAYVAGARVSGCGPHNVLLEVMADDHDRMLEILRTITDLEGVLAVNVLRVDPADTRGFGTTTDASSA